jgi:hypothetical protein
MNDRPSLASAIDWQMRHVLTEEDIPADMPQRTFAVGMTYRELMDELTLDEMQRISQRIWRNALDRHDAANNPFMRGAD